MDPVDIHRLFGRPPLYNRPLIRLHLLIDPSLQRTFSSHELIYLL